MPHLGQRLEQILSARQISKQEFGRRCGRSKQWVYALCQSGNWKASTIYSVAAVLDLSPGELLP